MHEAWLCPYRCPCLQSTLRPALHKSQKSVSKVSYCASFVVHVPVQNILALEVAVTREGTSSAGGPRPAARSPGQQRPSRSPSSGRSCAASGSSVREQRSWIRKATRLLIGDAIGDAFGAIIEMQDARGAQRQEGGPGRIFSISLSW